MSAFVKTFKYYLELLPEIRSVVIHEMCPDDRCRFTRTSKLSKKEAKAAKNFIESITFNVYSVRHMRILVSFSDSQPYLNCSYILEFNNDGARQYRTFTSNRNQEFSWTGLSDSKCLIEYAFENLKKLLRLYQNSIRKLRLKSEITISSTVSRLRITGGWKNLQELSIDGKFNSVQFLSQTKLPLKKVYISRDRDSELPMDKLHEVRDNLTMPDAILNYEQFSQLAASEIFIHIGVLTPEDVFNFLRAWQNGLLGKRIKTIHLSTRGSRFDVKQVFRLFGDHDYSNLNSSRHKLVLKHRFSIGKTAELRYYDHLFRVNIEDNGDNLDG